MKADDGSWLPIQPTEQEVRFIPEDAVKGSPQAPAVASRVGIPAAVGGSVISQADRAFAAQDLARARQLYEEAANQTRSNAEKSYCFSQLDRIEKAQSTTVASRPAAPGQLTGNTTALYNTQPQPANPAPANGPQWSSWGRLRKTTFEVQGRPVYVLENGQGQPLQYATTMANFTLDPYVGQPVCLWGQQSYASEGSFRNNILTVSQVALPQGR
jgi:hypothetical protein